MPDTLHPGWERISRLPPNVVICPRCGAPHQDKPHNWDEPEDGAGHQLGAGRTDGITTCTRPSCMERGRPVGLTVGQRRYPPTAQ